MAQHNVEIHFTIDGSGDLSGEISSMDLTFNQDIVETTNFDSSGRKERLPTLYDVTCSITLNDPQVDESSAGVLKSMYDGSLLSSGDGIYSIVAQKVTSGGTGGTATTTDPTYSFSAVADGFPITTGSVSDAVNQGATITFNSTGAITRATA